jgi:hypothetical protein
VVLLGPILPFEDRHTVPVSCRLEPGARHVPGVLIHAQSVRSIMGTGLLQPVPPISKRCSPACSRWCGGSAGLARGTLYVIAAAALVFASTRLMLHGLVLRGRAPSPASPPRRCPSACRRCATREKKFLKARSRLFSGRAARHPFRAHRSAGRTASAPACSSPTSAASPGAAVDAAGEAGLILNRYFFFFFYVVHKHHGTVDKFIGDGMMAIFGAPQQLEHPERNAIEAAQEMIERLAEVNAELAAQGEEPLKIGVGLHSGEIIVGHIGSRTRHEYTAIGDVVNVA